LLSRVKVSAVGKALCRGPERFVDMIPITIVSTDGTFIGIEGQETARRQMIQALEQSGTLHPVIGFAQKVTKAFFSVQPLCSLCLCG